MTQELVERSVTELADIDWAARAAALRPETELFIDGKFVAARSGARFADHSPRDGRVVAEVAFAGEADVDAAVLAARRAFDKGGWRAAEPAWRKHVLLRFAELIEAHREELALVETLDVGKPIRESLTVDVPACAQAVRWYAELIDKTYGEVAPTGPDAIATISREPLGVVGAVVPWNYPLIITAWKIAPALATGNSVVLKPAEQSPLSALVLARLAAEAGIPDGVFNVIPGDGPVTGAALGRHGDVDKLAFTGSVEVGRAFQRYAGESNGKSVSVELGGKSPQLVLADAGDLDAVAEAVTWGVYYNAGQTCHAGTRLVVDESVREPLVERIIARTAEFTVGDPLRWDTVLGPVIDEAAARRIREHIVEAESDGARLATGGRPVPPATAEAATNYLAPTVLDDVPNSSRAARAEIFGPVLCVQPFRGTETGVRIANDTPYGLAASVWSADISQAHRVAGMLRAGTVWINTYDASAITTPFGGFKDSGHGRDRSRHALDNYTAVKTTWLAL
ncbi:aldehyde dehydrogenase family protein [Tamaricihabitans halophyticus]|nr:aldehyde dehydrogenase family protein [Tamaricihabitans halophyticus]